MNDAFPDFIHRLPEADIPFEGLRGYLLQGESGLVLFLEAEREVVVSEHAHGDQWGFVAAGEMEFTAGGVVRTYRAGESYFVPAGMRHKAVLRPGFRAVDCFADRDRYRPKHGCQTGTPNLTRQCIK